MNPDQYKTHKYMVRLSMVDENVRLKLKVKNLEEVNKVLRRRLKDYRDSEPKEVTQ